MVLAGRGGGGRTGALRRIAAADVVVLVVGLLLAPGTADARAGAVPSRAGAVAVVGVGARDGGVQQLLLRGPGSVGGPPGDVHVVADQTPRDVVVDPAPVRVSAALVPYDGTGTDGPAVLSLATDTALSLAPDHPLAVAVGPDGGAVAAPTDLGGAVQRLAGAQGAARGSLAAALAVAARSLPSGPAEARAVVLIAPPATAARLDATGFAEALRSGDGSRVPLYVLAEAPVPPDVAAAAVQSGGRVVAAAGTAQSAAIGVVADDLSHWRAVTYRDTRTPGRVTVTATFAGAPTVATWVSPAADGRAASPEAGMSGRPPAGSAHRSAIAVAVVCLLVLLAAHASIRRRRAGRGPASEGTAAVGGPAPWAEPPVAEPPIESAIGPGPPLPVGAPSLPHPSVEQPPLVSEPDIAVGAPTVPLLPDAPTIPASGAVEPLGPVPPAPSAEVEPPLPEAPPMTGFERTPVAVPAPVPPRLPTRPALVPTQPSAAPAPARPSRDVPRVASVPSPVGRAEDVDVLDPLRLVEELRSRLQPEEGGSVAEQLRGLLRDWPAREDHSRFSLAVARQLDRLVEEVPAAATAAEVAALCDEVELHWLQEGLRPPRARWVVEQLVRTLAPGSAASADRARQLAELLDRAWAAARPTAEQELARSELPQRLARLTGRGLRRQVVTTQATAARTAELTAGRLLQDLQALRQAWAGALQSTGSGR